MNRNRLAVLIIVVLTISNVAYYFWKNWGLITISAADRPLAEIIRSIEKQGHVLLKSNLDPATKVTMDVEKVSLTEALETLSTVTDSRWRLAYIMAGDAASLQGALGNLGVGQKLEGWKTFYYPLFPTGQEEELDSPADPRQDTWTVQAPAEPKVQAYLDLAARNVSAAFTFPETWNPEVGSAPKSGKISKVAPALASAAHGKVQEVFLLQGGRQRGPGGDRAEGFDPDRNRGGGNNREAMEQRALAEIEKLPPDKRAAAKAEFDERKALMAEMRDLKPEDRNAKMEEIMERPEVQERIEKQRSERDARRTPAQRLARAQQYRDRKQQAMNKK